MLLRQAEFTTKYSRSCQMFMMELFAKKVASVDELLIMTFAGADFDQILTLILWGTPFSRTAIKSETCSKLSVTNLRGYLANIYLLKVNTRKRCKISSKLTTKTPQ